MECSLVSRVPQEASGELPCTHSSLSPCTAVQGLGTVVFQAIVLSRVFCQAKCLLKASNCLFGGALL